MIDVGRNIASPTDRQYVKKLLCGECEQRFSRVEDVVSRYWYKGSGFLLRNQLRLHKVYSLGDGQRYYPCYPVVGIAEDDLLYFSLSVFWRATQGGWGDYAGLTVDCEVVEGIRLYLLGEASAPSSVKVQVHVDWELITLPIAASMSAWWVLLGLVITVHYNPGNVDSYMRPIWSPGQSVDLVLDKKRCSNILSYTRKMALRTQADR